MQDKYFNLQDKYVHLQDNYVNLQHYYSYMQENCQHATYLCLHASCICWHATYICIILNRLQFSCMATYMVRFLYVQPATHFPLKIRVPIIVLFNYVLYLTENQQCFLISTQTIFCISPLPVKQDGNGVFIAVCQSVCPNSVSWLFFRYGLLNWFETWWVAFIMVNYVQINFN